MLYHFMDLPLFFVHTFSIFFETFETYCSLGKKSNILKVYKNGKQYTKGLQRREAGGQLERRKTKMSVSKCKVEEMNLENVNAK